MQGKASVNRLQLSNFKLDALLRITLAINENTPVDQLLEQFRSILCDDLRIGKILMFSYNQKWERILMSGVERRVADGIRVENDYLVGADGLTNLFDYPREMEFFVL